MNDGRGRQLPLALRYPPDQRLDTYLHAPDGLLEQVHAWATRANREWLFLVGAAGTGKTHLALAACAAAEACGQVPVYLPARAATGGRLRAALDSIDDGAMLVLDGVEAIAGGREDEVALFEVHNRMHDTGGALLYTARTAPDGLPLVLSDLRSRLSHCTRMALSPLDESGKRDVLLQRAERRGLVLEDASLRWLMKRVERDMGGLASLFDRLDRASMAEQRRITVPFLRDLLE